MTGHFEIHYFILIVEGGRNIFLAVDIQPTTTHDKLLFLKDEIFKIREHFKGICLLPHTFGMVKNKKGKIKQGFTKLIIHLTYDPAAPPLDNY